MLMLMAGVSGTGTYQELYESYGVGIQLHEVLHVHPSTQPSTTKDDRVSLLIYHLLSLDT
jgi:hypothetical protein